MKEAMVVKCGCGTHDIDVCNEEIVVIGDEKWRTMCAVRASARVIDELRGEVARLSRTHKEAERVSDRYNTLVERLKHQSCAECGYEVGRRFEVCGTGFFCPECYNRLAGYDIAS